MDFFYVLDRETGELISAEKYTNVNWASHVDIETGRPVKTEQGWYKDEPKLVIPSLPGGHSWNPMSFSPQTGLVYIPTIIYPWVYRTDEDFSFTKKKWGTGIVYGGSAPPFNEETKPFTLAHADTIERNVLKAWDPVKQKMVWEVENEIPKGNGGVLSTSGNLVFQGTNTGHLKVYNATSGKLLKTIETGTGIMAAPMSYLIDGEQFVAVMAGFGGTNLTIGPIEEVAAIHKYQNYGRILAFKLNGGTTPLPPKVVRTMVPMPPGIKLDEVMFNKGKDLFFAYCGFCHQAGKPEEFFSQYPNLAMMEESTHNIFKNIVLDGAYAQNGMASFKDVLNESDVDAIYQYITSLQFDIYEDQKKQKR